MQLQITPNMQLRVFTRGFNHFVAWGGALDLRFHDSSKPKTVLKLVTTSIFYCKIDVVINPCQLVYGNE